AKLAQPLNCFVVSVVDSFMMILLSQSSDSTRGMAHLCAFGKVLFCGSLPLVWAKFRYLVNETIIPAILVAKTNETMKLTGFEHEKMFRMKPIQLPNGKGVEPDSLLIYQLGQHLAPIA